MPLLEDDSVHNGYHTGRIKFWGETIGLYPLKLRMAQAKIAINGEEDVPPSQFDLSSLKQLRPGIALPLWFGKQRVNHKVIVSNCFNHLQTPIEKGWSVRITQTRDFRGRHLTYDSHNGTDFAVPIGTELLAAAPGKVVRVISEFNRGGLKVYIDHGQGLMTCSAHLARSLVKEGDSVARAQPIAVTGYSGLDSLVTFPWGTPHTHFNTWLNGVPVDPFPYEDETGKHASLFRTADKPLPYTGEALEERFSPSTFIEEKVNDVVSACLTTRVREKLERYDSLYERAAHAICEMNYYPTRFPVKVNMYDGDYQRAPMLDLPFHPEQFDGIVFADDVQAAPPR